MRVQQLAQQLGIHRTTVYRWAKKGLIPSVKTPGGRHILGTQEQITAMQAPITNNCALYLYWPLPERMDTQAEMQKLQAFADENDFTVDETVIEGSGYDQYLRKQLLRLLSQPTLRTIITNTRSLPSGWKFMSTALAASGRRFLVMDAEKVSDFEYRYQSSQTR